MTPRTVVGLLALSLSLLTLTAFLVPAQVAPEVDVGSVNPGTSIARDLCTTINIGGGGASECGDLRLGHGLPGTRTRNQTRTPILTYNSQHAHPYPVIHADVRLPSNGTVPDSVTAELRVGGVLKAQGKWTGSQWSAGSERRIVLAYDALGSSTGVYSYTLDVINWYGSTPKTTSKSGEFAIVNRSGSYFGAGWWLAGFEELYSVSGGFLWVGGDGSTRKYTSAGTNVWVAESVTRPDTLRWNGTLSRYVRALPGGVEVRFNSSLQHKETLNRLGDQTVFTYSSGRLYQVKLPTGSSAVRQYTFSYTSGKLTSVTAPPIGATSRITSVTQSSGRITRITDPDADYASFGYGSFANHITTRTDRRGTQTTFSYDAAKKMSQGRVEMGPDPDITTTLKSAERFGLAPTATNANSVHTWVRNPRYPEITAYTRFYPQRFGAPRRIRDPYNNNTYLDRQDSRFPGLVTRVRHPNGRYVVAAYNARGNPTSITDQSTNATTNYRWNDSNWPDFPTAIVPPEDDSTRIAYSSSTGNRIWQQDARGSSSRVNFSYYTSGAGNGLLWKIDGPLEPPTVITYDGTLGNLRTVTTPLGYTTTHYTDAIGRDTLVLSPIDAAETEFTRTRTEYNVMGWVTYTESSGDSLSYNLGSGTEWLPQEVVTVSNSYDDGGLLLSSTRGGSQTLEDDTWLTMSAISSYEYDAAGRKIEDDTNGRSPRNFAYDPAGNVTEIVTPRQDTIRMSYDLMNRVTQRIVPEVQFDSISCGPFEQPLFGTCPSPYQFPLYPNDADDGLRIPQDTAVFAYDAMGNMTQAFNIYARVSRTYNDDGTIATDTLRIRDYTEFDTGGGGGGGDPCDPMVGCPEGGFFVEMSSGPGSDSDFTTFVYVLTHEYDLNKRRTSTTYPPSVAPTTGAEVTYTYNNWGALGSVQNMFNKTHSLGYDTEGRFTSLTHPGSVSETRTYDDDSRLVSRARSDSDIDDDYTYDARGRITEITAGVNGEEEALSFYSALGHLGASRVYRGSPGIFLNEQEFTLDALGNASWRRENVGSYDPAYDYELSTGGRVHWIRLDRFDLVHNQGGGQDGIYSDTLRNQYDAGGNVQYHWRRQLTADNGTPSYSAKIAQTHYYGADERLRVTQRYNYDGDKNRGAYEEYWYDATGRRVMIRTRTDSATICNWNCDPGVTRFVWDGNHILMELRASNTSSQYSSGTQYGRVSYTHGAGIDRPFDVIKGSTVLVPYTNWRGLYAGATDVNGTWCSNPPSGSCDGIAWPGHNRRAFLDNKDSSPDPGDWWGTLIQDQADQSGLMYRRNRYYDPSTGQFTQEDPIGLAGGLNLYGYANGDPVNFSDPFGLAPLPDCCLKLIIMAVAASFSSDAVNEARISELDKPVQKPARAFMNLAAVGGMSLRITGGFRSFAEQDGLFAQGRTAPGRIVTNARGGESYHNYGLAIDVVELRDGRAIWDRDWNEIGALGKWAGFEWGGDWKAFQDRPHFQMTGGKSIRELQEERRIRN